MDHLIESYDYHLPSERIAQTVTEPREQSKLFVYNCASTQVEHKHIFDIPTLLDKGDVLVLNDTKVFKARVWARTPSGRKHKLLLIPQTGASWTALSSKTRKLHRNDVLTFTIDIEARIAHIDQLSGLITLEFNVPDEEIFAFTDEHGEVPYPPYIENQLTDLDTYQTTFASALGSVAAPTAGRHFTPALLNELRAKGVEIHFVTLHIGIGTFMPVRVDWLDDHIMHEEWVSISPEVAQNISSAKQAGRRVIAVGTTTTRALEGAALATGGIPENGYEGFVDLFIRPGFTFRVIDGIVTNFHLPKSTLLVLMSALVGREKVLELYQQAIAHEYRFYSLGDAMFIA